MRVVLDVNVIVSALLSRRGAPGQVLREWTQGGFELLVSAKLLDELERALEYPKLRRHISAEQAARALAWLRQTASVVADPAQPPPLRSQDPGDDYLLALAAAERAMLVTGDKHLLALRDEAPIFTAAEFFELVSRSR